MSERRYKSRVLHLRQNMVEAIVAGRIRYSSVRVYFVLYDHANKASGVEGEEVFPSQAKIAELTGIHRGTVQEAIKQLLELRWIYLARRERRGGVWPVNHYALRDDVERMARESIEAGTDQVLDFVEPKTDGSTVLVLDGTVSTQRRAETKHSTVLNQHEPKAKEPKATLYIDEVDAFEEFWSLFPTHKAKAKARTAWDKALAKTGSETILAAVRQQLPELAAKKSKGFGVHATTWLNQERWEDEVEGATVQAEVGAEWVALADRLAPPWRVGRNDEAILAAVAAREGWTAEELESRLSYFVEFYEALEWNLPSLEKVLTAPEGKLTDRYLEGLQADAKRPKRGRA